MSLADSARSLYVRPFLAHSSSANHCSQSHGAMENWGLITYRTTALLFDEKQSAASYKIRVAYVVAHGKSQIKQPFAIAG